jgi:hypothetical protein
MLRKNYFVFCIFLLLVFLQGAVTIFAQNNAIEPSLEIRPFTDLTLEISIPDQTVLSLQPIPIVIKQSNRTNQPAMGHKSIKFGLSPIRLYAKKNGTNTRVSIGNQSSISSYVFFTNVQIAPGESSETRGLITIGLNRYFPEPGIYEIQAALGDAERTQYIESNKVNVEIRMPTGSNLAAYNLIKNSALQDFIFSGVNNGRAEDILKTIVTTHSNTPYAKNSAFLLGETYFDLRQYPQALTYLTRLENDNSFIFAEKIRNYLAEIRRLLQIQQTSEKENQ